MISRDASPTTDRPTTPAGRVAKHWYTPLGYALGATLTLTALVYAQALANGPTAAAVREVTRVLFAVVSLVGLVVYPALFKDALHLDGRGVGRRPAWKAHVVFGFAVPLGVYAVATVQYPTQADELALLSHAAAATVVSCTYLYRRHRAVGLRSSARRPARTAS